VRKDRVDSWIEPRAVVVNGGGKGGSTAVW
jgi:hypothetical protein